jgi:hypothetical protein
MFNPRQLRFSALSPLRLSPKDATNQNAPKHHLSALDALHCLKRVICRFTLARLKACCHSASIATRIGAGIMANRGCLPSANRQQLIQRRKI